MPSTFTAGEAERLGSPQPVRRCWLRCRCLGEPSDQRDGRGQGFPVGASGGEGSRAYDRRVSAVVRTRGIPLRGYPMPMVLAEKLVTALQRGVASTRWRDFGDVYLLTGRYEFTAGSVTETTSSNGSSGSPSGSATSTTTGFAHCSTPADPTGALLGSIVVR
jgi:hypothetical protein